MSIKKFFSNKFTLAALPFLSGLISAYDNVLNVVFFTSLPVDERNPFASRIIQEYGVAGLVEIKSVGTILAVMLMLAMIKTKYKFVIYPVFLFQFALFYFLTFYVNDMRNFWERDFGLPFFLVLDFYKGLA